MGEDSSLHSSDYGEHMTKIVLFLFFYERLILRERTYHPVINMEVNLQRMGRETRIILSRHQL